MFMKLAQRILSIVVLLLLMISQSACRVAELAGDSSGVEDAPPPEISAEPSGVKARDEIKICMIGPTYLPYGQSYEEGASNAAAEAGMPQKNFIVAFTSHQAENEENAQLELLQEVISLDIDAILIVPVDSEVLAEPIAELFRSGIPVIVLEREANTDEYTAFLYPDEHNAGRAAAEELLKNMHACGTSEMEKAQVAILVGSMSSEANVNRMQGFTEYWNEHAPESWELLSDDIRVNEGDARIAREVGLDMISIYPDLKGVFTPSRSSTWGFIDAIEEADRLDIAIVGFDLTVEMRDMILANPGGASTIVRKQYEMGYDAVNLAIAILEGAAPPTDHKIDIGFYVVNRENVYDPGIERNAYF